MSFSRRSFLLWAGATGLSVGSAAYWRWHELNTGVTYPGRTEGHFLRDHQPLPAPSKILQTDVVILGSGIAGLTAAWKMKKLGQRDCLLIDGPQPWGNAAAGQFGELAYPTGAHYLPVPGKEAFHVREILSDLGIILRNPDSERPYYDERYLLHAPEERLLRAGKWQEGLLPQEDVPAAELLEHQRFFREMDVWRGRRDVHGKRVFAIPSVLSSDAPEWRQLDQLSFLTWLEQNNYHSPTLHWYLNYCCRDDYGRRYDQISAWAGLHYFCSRLGKAENAESGAWLTWPGGLQPLAQAMAAGSQRHSGTAVSLKKTPQGVEALCFELVNGQPQTFLVRARKAICAMPLHVAARVIEPIPGFDPAQHLPSSAPWLVANFLLRQFPQELPLAPLAWDNVVYQEPGLGYVVSTHQDIRVAPPEKTVFTAYLALSDKTPQAARHWLESASAQELLAAASVDLQTAYGWKFASCVERVDITVRAHAMAIPAPGFRSNAGLQCLRELDGPILFAHADLSGFSVFEEASWWGYRAALLAMK